MDLAVAITGMGMVTAQGVGVEETWRGVVAGREVLRPWVGGSFGADHPLAALKVARCVEELPRPGDIPGRLWKKLSRTQQLAALAVGEALDRAHLPRRLEGMRVGLFLATTVCGMDKNEQFYAQYRVDREAADIDLMRRIEPYEVGELIARRHGIGRVDAGRGRWAEGTDSALNQVCMTTCVGSAMAIGNAADAIMLGECDVAIAGGAEAMCRVVLSGFHALKVVSAEGCRPFDKNRPGITVGEGSGVLILESVEHARRRGAEVLGYLRGFGVTCDVHHLTAPDPAAVQAGRAIREGLARAGILPGDVGYINAHGTGTRDNDSMETRAIREVFGVAEGLGGIPPVSSTKRCTGHTFGAAAAIESIFCVKALREQVVPPQTGTVEQDPLLELPLVKAGHAQGPFPEHGTQPRLRAAVCTNFAFGGNNTALVFSLDGGGI